MNEENNEIDDSTFHPRHLEVKDHPRSISFNPLRVFDINESFIFIFVCLNWPMNKGQTSDTSVFQVSSSSSPDWCHPFDVESKGYRSSRSLVDLLDH
jgi:hypothetical protein